MILKRNPSSQPYCTKKQRHWCAAHGSGAAGGEREVRRPRFRQSAWPRPFSVRACAPGASGAGTGGPAGLAPAPAGGHGPAAHRGVRFSFMTRGGVAFLSESRTLAGGGCAAPFSALPAPRGAWGCPGSAVPAGDGALGGAERSAAFPPADCRVPAGDTLTDAEFLTLIWVLVEGPRNLTGLGPVLQFTPSSSSSLNAISRLWIQKHVTVSIYRLGDPWKRLQSSGANRFHQEFESGDSEGSSYLSSSPTKVNK